MKMAPPSPEAKALGLQPGAEELGRMFVSFVKFVAFKA